MCPGYCETNVGSPSRSVPQATRGMWPRPGCVSLIELWLDTWRQHRACGGGWHWAVIRCFVRGPRGSSLSRFRRFASCWCSCWIPQISSASICLCLTFPPHHAVILDSSLTFACFLLRFLFTSRPCTRRIHSSVRRKSDESRRIYPSVDGDSGRAGP